MSLKVNKIKQMEKMEATIKTFTKNDLMKLIKCLIKCVIIIIKYVFSI